MNNEEGLKTWGFNWKWNKVFKGSHSIKISCITFTKILSQKILSWHYKWYGLISMQLPTKNEKEANSIFQQKNVSLPHSSLLIQFMKLSRVENAIVRRKINNWIMQIVCLFHILTDSWKPPHEQHKIFLIPEATF